MSGVSMRDGRGRAGRQRRQFGVLWRIFLLRVVDVELLSPESDVVKLLGQMAAMLAGVSVLFTAPLILLGGRLPAEALWTMEHLLLSTTMAVAGVFAVLSWESTFPERRDLLVLGPLPVSGNVLFGAKLAATGAALGLGVVALNVFTGLIWPLLFAPFGGGIPGAARSVGAYWLTTAAAAVFVFWAVLGVQWVVSLVLPRQVYLRVSAVLQATLLCAIVGGYFLEPSMSTPADLGAPGNQPLLAWLPTYWFLGMFEQVNGSRDPAFLRMALRAWEGLGAAVLVAGSAVMTSYLRMLRKIVEEPEIVPGARGARWMTRPRGGFGAAITMFAARTVLRSRQHRLLLTMYVGVGMGVVLAYVKAPLGPDAVGGGAARWEVGVPYLAGSLLMLGCVLGGLRMVLTLPIDLRANVVFRMSELRSSQAYARAVRRTFYTLGYGPAMGLVALPFLWMRPRGEALEHLLLLALLGVIVVELAMYRFRKIPFTCSYLPGKTNVPVLFWGCVLLLLPLVSAAAALEMRLLERPGRFVWMLLAGGAAAWTARWRTTLAMGHGGGLEFEERAAPELMGLGLDRGDVAVAERS